MIKTVENTRWRPEMTLSTYYQKNGDSTEIILESRFREERVLINTRK